MRMVLDGVLGKWVILTRVSPTKSNILTIPYFFIPSEYNLNCLFTYAPVLAQKKIKKIFGAYLGFEAYFWKIRVLNPSDYKL